MNSIYLISQILGFIAFIISLIAYHKNKKEKIFKTINELQVKKSAFYCYFLWLLYNICIFSIAGIISNIISIISTFIAVHNEKLSPKYKKQL